MKAKDQETVDLVCLLKSLGFTHREVAEELNARGIYTQADTRWHKWNIRKVHKTKRPAAAERPGPHSNIEYGWTSDGSRLIPCDEEREILDSAYKMRVEQRMSYSQIAKVLNASGHRNRAGSPWTSASIARVMSSRIDPNLDARIDEQRLQAHREMVATARDGTKALSLNGSSPAQREITGPSRNGPGAIPYGWMREGHALVPCPEEENILSLVRTLRLEQRAIYRRIANTLNAYGYRTRGGSSWTVTRVNALCLRQGIRLDKSVFSCDGALKECRDNGMSYAETAEMLNSQQVVTETGKRWTAANVAYRCRKIGLGGVRYDGE